MLRAASAHVCPIINFYFEDSISKNRTFQNTSQKQISYFPSQKIGLGEK
jgi:hypothetical protein